MKFSINLNYIHVYMYFGFGESNWEHDDKNPTLIMILIWFNVLWVNQLYDLKYELNFVLSIMDLTCLWFKW